MPARDRAAYMRDYRQRLGTKAELPTDALHARIAELEEEVRRLKRELAARPTPLLGPPFLAGPPTVHPRNSGLHQFGTPRPAPKPSRRSR